jgi:hypothetical protein
MPITQILLTAVGGGATTYTITPDANNVNEGSSLTFTVSGNNITNGTYYWDTPNEEELEESSGSFTITGNSGTFTVTALADSLYEGSHTFTVRVHSDSVSGTILATSESITINDTSAVPTAIMTLTANGYAGSGTTWADSSGFNHPGTLFNTPTFVNTVPKHFSFDRTSNEWVYAGDVGSLPTWTIESWFRLSEPLSNTEATAIITTTYSDDYANNFGVINYVLGNFVEGVNGGNNELLTVGFFLDGQWRTTTGFVPNVGEWYHVIGTYDGDTIKQWVNGVLDSDRTFTATTRSAGGPVRIGRRWDGPSNDDNQFFPGDIAVAKIYYGVITDEQIVQAFDTTKNTYPNVTLTPDADNVDEGSSLTFTVSGSNIADGTYYWTVNNGTSSNGDFASTSGSFEVSDNSGTFSVTPDADATTEGSETFTVSMRSGSISGTVLKTSGSITINDTSLDPTYIITPAVGSIDEGNSIQFDISGTDIPGGTYYWTIETSSEDFDTTSGSFEVSDSAGSFTVTPAADIATEGDETFTVAIRSGSISGPILQTSDPVTINDTSRPSYTLTPDFNNVNEGSALVIQISGSDIPDGTYYWTIQGASGEFGTSSGEVTITDNYGIFTVTPTADATTEGSETFTVQLRSGSISGTVLQTTNSITINDTSLDPEPPFSLMFNTPQQDFLRVPASSDFNLGNNWTIEFWLKANNSSNAGVNIPGGQWGLINQSGWYTGMANDNSILVGLAGGNLTINQSANDDIQFAEPPSGGEVSGIDGESLNSDGGWDDYINPLATTGGTGTGLTVNAISLQGNGYIQQITIANPGLGYTEGDTITITNEYNFTATFNVTVTDPLWTHVAIVNNGGGSAQKVYYNGREQTKVSGSYTTNGKTNTSDDLYIGRLAPNYASYFDGKMALVRISNTAKYLTAFNPSVTYGVESDTVLFLDSDTPLVDTSYYELNNVTMSNTNGGTIYFAKSTYPNLDKQVRAGNTVVHVSNSTTSVVTGAVFTADPDNWGITVSPAQMAIGAVNFSGARHTIVNNGTTESDEFPGVLTVRQWLGTYDPVSGNSTLVVRVADYPTAATIPAGARGWVDYAGTITEVTVESNNGSTQYSESVRQINFFSSGGNTIAAGTYATFIWSAT